jgi:hypothetical protein
LTVLNMFDANVNARARRDGCEGRSFFVTHCKLPLTACVSSFILLLMGTLSFVRRHSTLVAFTVSLGASVVFVACGSDNTGTSTDGGTGGTDGGIIETGGSSSGGKGGAGGTAGKGGTGGTAGSAGKAGGGAGGGVAGSAGSGGEAGDSGDVITSNGDAAADSAVPDGN